jgi:hypothetical protein
MSATASALWARRTQDRTLVTAHAKGERWERDDLELVSMFTDTVTDELLALVLGRSLFALWAIQHRMRSEGFEAVMLAASGARTQQRGHAPVRPLSSRTYTFIGDDVPEGWRD